MVNCKFCVTDPITDKNDENIQIFSAQQIVHHSRWRVAVQYKTKAQEVKVIQIELYHKPAYRFRRATIS
jgi:hypothetical protein